MSKNTSQSVLLKFLLHLHPPRIPADSAKFTYTFGLGGLTLFAFFVTLISGIVLLFLYSPTPETAHQSLEQIATVTPYGWYLRNLHFWAAQVMVIAAVLHMLRVVLTGGYLNGRAFNWVIGVILLIFVFLMDFTGFPLRWDAESHWALVVGTNLLKTIPMVGQSAYQFVVGGPDIGHHTLLRFYGWHIFGLPFIATLFIVYHVYRVRKDGGISRKSDSRRAETISRETLLGKEAIYMLLAGSGLILISVIFTPHLGASARSNPAVDAVQAPWIFLGIQFLLRYISPFMAGIVIPFAVLAYWFALPYLETQAGEQGIWAPRNRRIFWLPFSASLGIIATLMLAEVWI
jgi:quinol-cytochrome oxidoreductase complex cytochrome b subunit